MLPEGPYWTKLHLSGHNLCLHETIGIGKSKNCCYWTFGPCRQKQDRRHALEGDFAINKTDPAPPLLNSPPHCLIPSLSQDIRSSVRCQHPQEPPCKATKMSWLCLSAALLFLLVILVDSTPVYEHHTQDQGRSRLTSPLQILGKWWKSMEWGGQVLGGCCQPCLDFSCHIGQDFYLSGWFWQHWSSCLWENIL